MNPTRLLLLASLCAFAVTGWTRDRPFLDNDWDRRDDVEETGPWQESDFELPPYPEQADLVEFRVDDPGSRFRYFLDGKNLSVSEDGVVRYTLVIRSGSGTDNVSVEGLRCDHNEVRVYAYGGARHQFHALEGSPWEPIRLNGPYRYHTDLREFFLCNRNTHTPYPVADILHRLQATSPREQNSVYF